MKNVWNKIPEQIKRISAVIIISLVLFLIFRNILIPNDFGKYGHYRPEAVREIIKQEMRYAGQVVCFECHEDVVAFKSEGFHKNVACEVCHGPAFDHTQDPGSVDLPAPRERGYCPRCHEYLPSRPTGFPQIVSASHNPLSPCISCHEPHNPEPPVTPKECSACHAEIARTKSVSHHVNIPCTKCHDTPDDHKIRPREVTPGKPSERGFCGQCHSNQEQAEKRILQVDLATHHPRYVCWQCHYPHLPETQ